MSVICEICNSKVSNKYNLVKHKQTESCQKIKRELDYNKNINSLNNKIKELENEIINLKKNNNEKDLIIYNLQEKSNNLQEKSEEYRKIIEKAATKTSIKNNYTNNYLNLISSEPIRFNELPRQLKQVVNCESLMYDDTEFHNHIVDNILKDENGKDKILCTDINRKNFSYKDESSGELVSDPELEKLRDILKKGADIKSVKRELLNKLIEQYDNTDIDPYVKFCDILKKLDFGNPFVDHVAKKTYIKTKTV